MTTEEVCGRLSRAGIDTKTVSKVFAARLEPENLEDPDKKHVLAVPEPGGRIFLVVYQFGLGEPLRRNPRLDMPQEQGQDWRPRWLSVEGPFRIELDEEGRPLPGCEVLMKARELTSA